MRARIRLLQRYHIDFLEFVKRKEKIRREGRKRSHIICEENRLRNKELKRRNLWFNSKYEKDFRARQKLSAGIFVKVFKAYSKEFFEIIRNIEPTILLLLKKNIVYIVMYFCNV